MLIFKNKATMFSVFASLIVAALLMNGSLHFEIWSQIEFMNKADFDPGSMGMIAHLPRYITVLPVYFFSEYFNFEPNEIYGFYLLLLSNITFLTWLKTREALMKPRYIFSPVLVIPFLILLVTSGRFIIGLLGLSLLLYSVVSKQEKFQTKNAALTAIGLLFCSVSSGVFTVGLIFIVLSTFSKNSNRLQKKSKIPMLFAMIPAVGLTVVFLIKNLEYYSSEGYGFFGIISHGVGMVLNPLPVLNTCQSESVGGLVCNAAQLIFEVGSVLPLITTLLFFLLVYVGMVFFNPPTSAKRGVLISIVGGVFGLTTLMSFIFIVPVFTKRKNLKKNDF